MQRPLSSISRYLFGAALLLAGLMPVAFVVSSPEAPEASGAEDIPAWVLEDMAQGVGRWVADNAAYQSDDEPYDAYGMDWTWGLGKKSLTGRLFGLQDGNDVGTFWEFRQFWHPGKQQVMVYQFGSDGTVGIGAHERIDEHTSQALQTFYSPDGTTFRVGHRTETKDGERHGQSYDVDEDGVWTERRFYLWRRADDSPKE